MHYAEYKLTDPSLVRDMVETFPFSNILVNASHGPLVAHAPITFRPGRNPAGAIEFHLAAANEITSQLAPGTPVTVVLNGPGAAVSPAWFTASFPRADSDRSKTAPTYNYLSLVIRGTLIHLHDEALQAQIRDLVLANETPAGWRLSELDPQLWSGWRQAIRGYRLEVDYFDLTAKLSHGDIDADRPGVVDGLTRRGLQDDATIARLVGGYDGTASSFRNLLRSLTAGPAA